MDYFSLVELKDISDIPKIGVYGNHDSGTYFEPLGMVNLHLKTFKFANFTFAGFEGSVRYKESPSAKMYTQEEAFNLLKDFPIVDVFISHSPPYGVNDEPDELAHQGFKALRKYIEFKKPKYFLHGHTYPTKNMVSVLGETKIFYVYADKIIDLEYDR